MRHRIGVLVGLATAMAAASSQPAAAKVMLLHEGWTLQSACQASDPGSKISSAGYSTVGWLPASVPSTVLAAQVAAGLYKDIYFGINLRSIPGATYPVGENFSNLSMPTDSPYRCGWWYRKQLDLSAADAGKKFGLQLDGINYSADIWVNGTRDSRPVASPWRVPHL